MLLARYLLHDTCAAFFWSLLPFALSFEESHGLLKNIVYSMSFPKAGPSAPAGAAAHSAEGESKARGSRKPEVFE